MYYDGKIYIAKSGDEKIFIEPSMANRHGLIAGATGTGKTITLKVMAESFSDAGVPVFMADVKGDLSGMMKPGADTEDMRSRIAKFGLDECGFKYQEYPSEFWDIYGKMGIPLRTTISEMGPLLLARLMNLNETQTNILTIVFKIADENDLLLIDTKDLKSILQYVSEHNSEYSAQYGNIAKNSVGAILRGVVALEAQGGDFFFGEPALSISDWFATGAGGKGMINILDCRELINNTTMYATFLLWMMSELFEILPEVGDMDKPRMVFFFDEAHLLFDHISRAFEDKIEQVVKLIRSKGVGIYFITQNPRDIPDEVLAQLGNKVQHALRAYTPTEQKAVKAAAASFRVNPEFDTKEAIMNLGTGEALISVLDEDGIPTIVKQCKVLPPQSLMGPVDDEVKMQAAKRSNLYIKYQDMFDRDSAYEFLERLNLKIAQETEAAKQAAIEEKERIAAEKAAEKEAQKQAAAEQKEKEREAKARKAAAGRIASTAGGTVGREVGNVLGKTVGGSFGKKLGGNVGAALGRGLFGTFFKK